MPDPLRFDHYEVLTRDDGSLFELGRGAMGITYKALDTNLRTTVCLKVINAACLHSDSARQRFVREARSAARLRNPHVAAVYHLGTEGEHYYYAMEFIDGETVDSLIKRHGPITPVLALKITDQVAYALQAAEPHGLVHRDLKPANLMLVREGEEITVKVIDFGLAKSALPGEGEESATISLGGFVGTPHFASPEQLAEGNVDVRSDIYSLGVTLWFMLAGTTPFRGSMAQVMSQHLSRVPPFEQLSAPAGVARLLRRLLEKDPAARPQSPVELRREIEECLAQLGPEGSVAAPGPGLAEDEQNFATRLDQSSGAGGSASFQVGATVAARYRLLEALGDSNAGQVFRAHDLSHTRDVRLVVLHRQLIADRGALSALEREVEKTIPIRHANLLRVDALETVDGTTFLVLEWTNGCTLLELLRARRELTTPEALAVLAQAAAGVDHALACGLTQLDLALHQVFLHFAGTPPAKEQLTGQPLGDGAEFTVKVHPLGITRELTLSAAIADGQTIVGEGMSSGTAKEVAAKPRAVRALAAITYELLGGNLSPLGLAEGKLHYSPLPALSEEGNEVLRRALDPEPDLASASELHRALAASEMAGRRRSQARSGTPLKTSPSRLPGIPGGAPARRRFPKRVFSTLTTLALVAAVGYFFANPPEGQEESRAPNTSTVAPVGSPARVASESAPPTSVPPGPSRRELLNAAVERAKALEEQRAWPECLAAWVKVAKEFPESDVGRTNLEAVIGAMRVRPNGMTAEEFAALEEPLADAAQLDVLAAMMALGEQWRKSRPVDSFAWYSAAAAKNDPEAMVQVGLMFSNGAAGERDLTKALYYFERAAELGHAPGKTALGDCYLFAKGVERDEKRAATLLKEAVDGGDKRAMDLLGTCYDRGWGMEKNPEEAARLYERSSKLGYYPALGNLGVLYINGSGVKQDAQKAVELFRSGTQAGDGYCMFLLARCFEGGTGLRPNMQEAVSWYQRAARAGNPQATAWCEKNGVPLDSP